MKKLQELDVIIDGGKTVYRPGDTMTGIALVINTVGLSIRGIEVRCRGKMEATIFVGDYDTQKVHCLRKEALLLGSMPRDRGEQMMLEPGHHEYPFKFVLPLGIPNTFNCEGDECGFIAYSLDVIVHGITKFSYCRKRWFQVNVAIDLNSYAEGQEKVYAPIDLNATQGALDKVEGSSEKLLSFMGFKSGTVSITVRLPRKGYEPGEDIPISGCVTNSSGSRLKTCFVRLQQIVTISAHGTSRVIFNKIEKGCERGPIQPGQSQEWESAPLAVPKDLVPSSEGHGACCTPIDVQYEVWLVVQPSWVHSKLHLSVPIVVGTFEKPVTEDVVISKTFSTSFDFGSRV